MRSGKSGAMVAVLAVALVVGLASEGRAAPCGSTASGFRAWLRDFKAEAEGRGISRRTIDAALQGVSYSRKVIGYDRNQKSFKLSFKQFWARRVNDAMISKAKKLKKRYRKTFASIERRYGVPPEILLAIWGLETGFGRNSGSMPVFRSLATLAYDCRRSEFFTRELMSALRIVDRGDMRPAEMKGAWAGELGQTQFLASSYVKYAVDFDRNGRADLIRSVGDVLASTANFLKAHGWRRGGGWAAGSANYGVLKKWNKAEVYQKTIALMAAKIAS